MRGVAIVLAIVGAVPIAANAEAWRNCVPNSVAPGGRDSVGPGGG